MSTSLPQALIAHFDSVFVGPNGDYPAVLEILAGVPADQAIWRPAPGCNSIWQIVDHLAACNVWQTDMLEQRQAAPPAWTEPTGGEAAWQSSIERLRETHDRLKTGLARVSQDSLFAKPVPDWPMTLLEFLLSWAAHEAHHCGQMDYLKGLCARATGK